jgi:endonuclease-3
MAAKPVPGSRTLKKSPAPKKTSGHGVAKRDHNPERVEAILKILAETYPEAECALNHKSAWELLVATILSAQCTDVRVNMVTPKLFETYPTPKEMAAAPTEALEALIRSTGFYHNKAKSIQGAGRVISEQFAGKVPETLAELLTVPGAARKTANVVLGVAYRKAEGVVVDTHVFRIARRLGLARGETPQAVEQELMKVVPKDRWIQISHELILHGRAICDARKPKCRECPLETLCQAKDKTWHS